jgi:hypothetical protein
MTIHLLGVVLRCCASVSMQVYQVGSCASDSSASRPNSTSSGRCLQQGKWQQQQHWNIQMLRRALRRNEHNAGAEQSLWATMP